MQEIVPVGPESQLRNFSYLESYLGGLIHAKSEWSRFDGKEPGDDYGAYELGITVEDIIDLINDAASLKTPKALIISSNVFSLADETYAEAYIQRVRKMLPPIERTKNFDPEIVKALANKAGLLPRRAPETTIFSRDVDSYPNPEGRIQKVLYNIIPLKLPGLVENVYWHELIQGAAYLGNLLDVLVTVNKHYIPTTFKFSPINRLVLKAQGI